ncbi:MAG: PD-(D/E)XK nuclease family protein [Flavobacteriaceae bacterium]|nr:PD-(D/E)XK nuclease family protein [Flavobacteriaceae bacterium]
MSGLQLIDHTSLLFEFYRVHKSLYPHDTERFDSFIRWAGWLLRDFNEIDCNLVKASDIFSYLSDLKRIDVQFDADEVRSAVSANYLNFIQKFQHYYNALTSVLKEQKIGYQGMLFKEAENHIFSYLHNGSPKKHVLVGFNALNRAEEKIFNSLLSVPENNVYWDYDAYYFKNNNSIGSFVNKYLKEWPYFRSNKIKWVGNYLAEPKEIHVLGSPLDISQIKNVGALLEISADKVNNYQNTAIILGDENLLPVVLNSLPKDVKSINITMGIKLSNTGFTELFDRIFKLHLNRLKSRDLQFLFRDLVALFDQNCLSGFIDILLWEKFKQENLKTNKLYFNENELKTNLDRFTKLPLDFLFFKWDNGVNRILEIFLHFIESFEKHLTLGILDKEYLFRFKNLFRQLSYYHETYGYFNDLKGLYKTFLELLAQETLPFKGEPLSGLQIMGMLESRALDFENIIITSVNEGVLPAGKSVSSFLPFDIRVAFGLPTYKEKDTIYAYHFFRLLQRAKKIHLLYNAEVSNFGAGEKSRFITQLEVAKESGLFPELLLNNIISQPLFQADFLELRQIEKTVHLESILEGLAKNGFSPSALNLFIRNPFDFYKRKVLKLSELEEMEDSVAQKTFGTIIHDALHMLYTPYVAKFLVLADILNIESNIDNEVNNQFIKHFASNNIHSGRNYIGFMVAKKYIHNFVHYEKNEIQSGKAIKILALEEPLKIEHRIPGLEFPVILNGRADRIDQTEGITRIVDYKTGKVAKSELILKNWEDLILDEKNSKSLQVLFYAYLYKQTINHDTEISSGIYSFKNLKQGFLQFNGTAISGEDLQSFVTQLDLLILTIFNKTENFLEKEVDYFNYK